MLSVIVITKNEAHNIDRCLASVDWAQEIIVVDSGSSDATLDIAKRYTNKIYTTDWQGYGVQKQRALALATGDWVLNLDADESVDAVLKKELQHAMMSNQASAYRIPIQMHFYGKPLRFSASPKRHVRLFKRLGAAYSNDVVHEKVLLPQDAKILKISKAITHHSFRDVSHMLYKLNKYSSYSAKTRLANGRLGGLMRVLLGMYWMFFRCYVLQGGFLDGRPGFLFAFFNAEGTFYRGIKQLYPDEAPFLDEQSS